MHAENIGNADFCNAKKTHIFSGTCDYKVVGDREPSIRPDFYNCRHDWSVIYLLTPTGHLRHGLRWLGRWGRNRHRSMHQRNGPAGIKKSKTIEKVGSNKQNIYKEYKTQSAKVLARPWERACQNSSIVPAQTKFAFQVNFLLLWLKDKP